MKKLLLIFFTFLLVFIFNTNRVYAANCSTSVNGLTVDSTTTQGSLIFTTDWGSLVTSNSSYVLSIDQDNGYHIQAGLSGIPYGPTVPNPTTLVILKVPYVDVDPDFTKPFTATIYDFSNGQCVAGQTTFSLTAASVPPAGGVGLGGTCDPAEGVNCASPYQCLGINGTVGTCGTSQAGVGQDCSTTGVICASGTTCDPTTKQCVSNTSYAQNVVKCNIVGGCNSLGSYTLQCDTNGCDTALGRIGVTPANFIKSLFTVILTLVGGIAVLLIIISGYRIATSRGDPERLKGAQEQLTAAIIGLLFIIFSLIFLEVIGVDLLGLNIPIPK